MSLSQRVFRGQLYWTLVPLAMLLSLWQGWSWWSWASSPVKPNANLEESKIQLAIEQGTSAKEIGQSLAAAGLIRSTHAWDLWSRWLGVQQRFGQPAAEFQAGTYELSPAESLPTIATAIQQGRVVQSRFTIPEGWTIQQMGQYFQAQGFFSAQSFVAASQKIPYDQFPWLPPNLPHLEGFLFPDTYTIPQGTVTPESVIASMLSQFERQALPLYQQAQAAGNTQSLKDWVTLSSIVEKEAVVPDERTLIAGVLSHRLRIGMNLEVDPTVEYGLGIQQTPDRPLTYAQVDTPSPYNTYLNPGLPPTAVSSPGFASLKAVLNPQPTEYLFYVARYDGTHVFSRTFAEHLAAQDKIHDARESRAAATASPQPQP